MRASPRLLVLLLVALHLQCLYTKYYLVETDGKAASLPQKHARISKHGVSSRKTSQAKTGSARPKDKKSGRVRRKYKKTDRVRRKYKKNGRVRRKNKENGRFRRKNIGVDYFGDRIETPDRIWLGTFPPGAGQTQGYIYINMPSFTQFSEFLHNLGIRNVRICCAPKYRILCKVLRPHHVQIRCQYA